jgi:hypothetical protein
LGNDDDFLDSSDKYPTNLLGVPIYVLRGFKRVHIILQKQKQRIKKMAEVLIIVSHSATSSLKSKLGFFSVDGFIKFMEDKDTTGYRFSYDVMDRSSGKLAAPKDLSHISLKDFEDLFVKRGHDLGPRLINKIFNSSIGKKYGTRK